MQHRGLPPDHIDGPATAGRWFGRVDNAPPPTDDDVCITRDGRRLDSPEKVRAFLDELNTSVAAERAAAKG